jgi:hypothetical protein
VFLEDKLADVTPGLFVLTMRMTPEEANRVVTAAGGTRLEETIPERDSQRAGMDRQLEPEIRIFQADARRPRGLDLPGGVHKVTLVFAGGRLYKVTLYAKYFWSNLSPRRLASANVPGHISRQQDEPSFARPRREVARRRATTANGGIHSAPWRASRPHPRTLRLNKSKFLDV